MSLRTQAEADLASTLEASQDFGFPIVLTDPSGNVSNGLMASAGDIGASIDPDTGMPVSGRRALLTVRMATLTAQGFTTLPEGVQAATASPWIVAFAGPSSGTQLYKVKRSMPDRTLGIVTMDLEFWRVV